MTYIHPEDERIIEFSEKMSEGCSGLEAVCKRLFTWFDENIEYSRLNAPFFPLQRSDIDLLMMRSGTCGDYSNLLVSVLSAVGFDACYAYVHKDCFGDAQDHICAAVKTDNGSILIDATPPYRKWHGFGCPHRDVELLSPAGFEQKMKQEEQYWRCVADKHNMSSLAGLMYAPWIHAESVCESEDMLDDVFFLLLLNGEMEPTLYAYYRRYTAQKGFLPVMAAISATDTLYHFSVHPCEELWDNGQWSEGFSEAEIPAEYISEELKSLKTAVTKRLSRINEILHQAGCRSLVF